MLMGVVDIPSVYDFEIKISKHIILISSYTGKSFEN